MKALLQLVVEVDFDKIIDDSAVESLKKFTGAHTKEGVGKFYLDHLAKSIIDDNLRKDHISYNIEGTVIPDEQVESQQEDVSDLSDYNLVDVVEDEQPNNTVDVVNSILEFIENVSINKGIPKKLEVTAEVFDMFVSELNLSIKKHPTEGLIALWYGIPVNRVDSDYVMAVDYVPFQSDDETIETEYMRTLAKTL